MEPLPIASSLVVTNDDGGDLIVCVEPWGFEFALGGGEKAKIIIRASGVDPTGVRSQHARITVEFLGAGEAALEVWVRDERIH
jgi:hypothetical protein